MMHLPSVAAEVRRNGKCGSSYFFRRDSYMNTNDGRRTQIICCTLKIHICRELSDAHLKHIYVLQKLVRAEGK
jgi:hypothetical protein